jgi:propanol-preferring alcohol dehydrogenase
MADIDETLDFARRGRCIPSQARERNLAEADDKPGKLRLEPTVVGLSKFNEAVQKLRHGQVAG